MPEVTANIFNFLGSADREAMISAIPSTKFASTLAAPIFDNWDYFRIKEYAMKHKSRKAEVTRYFDKIYNNAMARYYGYNGIEKHDLIERIYFLNGYKNANLGTITVAIESPEPVNSKNYHRIMKGINGYKIDEESQYDEESRIGRYTLSWSVHDEFYRIDGPAIIKIVNGKTRQALYADGDRYEETHYDEGGNVEGVYINGILVNPPYQ